MGKHRKPPRIGSLAPLVTAGLALEVVGVLAGTYATNPTISDVGLAARHSIFVDGTKSPFLTDVGDPRDRMRYSFNGLYDFAADEPADEPEFVDYPGTLGLASILSNGLGAPTFDASEQAAVDDLFSRVKTDQTSTNPSEMLYVVGYSQGGSAVVRAVKELENTDEFHYNSDKVIVVLAANPRRNDGGLLTRFPSFTLPLVGATFGEGTNPSQTKIVQVTKQYDGVADAPVYFLNVFADANAILGYVYLHGGNYQDVTIDPLNPPADATVTTHSQGRVTDILLPNKPGQLPLTRPLLSLGIPQSIVTALDPLLRAIIETGYDRPANGAVTSDQAVGFKLLPAPDKWVRDAQSVAAGASQTALSLTTPTPSSAKPQPITRSTERLTQAEKADKAGTVDKADTAHDKDQAVMVESAPRKFTPARSGPGGWKPGALLRGVRDAVSGAVGSRPASAQSVTLPADPVATSATVGSAPEKDSATTAAAS